MDVIRPRRPHHKSRTGCLQCKARKVKVRTHLSSLPPTSTIHICISFISPLLFHLFYFTTFISPLLFHHFYFTIYHIYKDVSTGLVSASVPGTSQGVVAERLMSSLENQHSFRFASQFRTISETAILYRCAEKHPLFVLFAM
jgi:hypothetical protein